MHSTDAILLRELLSAGTAHVPGPRLAARLGVSRGAVARRLHRLAAQGFGIAAAAGCGYRLTGTPTGLHEALIQAHLAGRRRPPHIHCLARVDSTNSEAERLLAAGAPAPFVVIAREQTQGRGRRGRPWHSAANGNLYLSFAFRPHLEPARLQDFTLWMGLNVCDLIANFCHLNPGLKWPNDVLIDGRKVGGMLTEARIDADHVRELVFGLGLNVNGRAASLPADLRRIATTLAEATGAPLDLNRFAAALIGRLDSACSKFLAGGHRDDFAALWKRHDILRGRQVTLIQGERTVRGTATGIDDEGSLIVRLDSGRQERFRAGEVTLGKEPA